MKKILLLLALILLVSFVMAVDGNNDSNTDIIQCTTEGQSMPVYPGYACCSGLVAINPQTSEEPIVGASICSDCGNGLCEEWENQYNCPSDCEETVEECIEIYKPVCGEITTCSISDCEVTSDENAICESGVCSITKKTYTNDCYATQAGATILYSGECGSDQLVSERVKCVFDDTTAPQKCYLAGNNDIGCSTRAGEETCTVEVKDREGKSLTWKSSCGGYAYTIMDGISEYAKFRCKNEIEEVKENVKCVLWNAKGREMCYSEKGKCEITLYDNQTNTQHGTCVLDVVGEKGETVTWKSDCGGYAYTIMDGENEYAEFRCDGTKPPIQECACTKEYAPVCGKNGKTYGNACEAKCARQEVGYRGECNAIGQDGYKKAKWICSNEESFSKESDTCETYAYWKQMAIDSCNEFSTTTCTVDSNIVIETSSGQGNNASGSQNNQMATVSSCISQRVTVMDFDVGDKCDVKCETYDENDCRITRCDNGTITESCKDQVCESQNIEHIKKIKENCYENNGKVLIEIDNKGCDHYVCVSENAVCKKEISGERVLKCKERGGEILSKTDKEGCITLFECSIEDDSNVEINKEIINDETKLLELALKLEGLRIELDKTAKKLGAIAAYYNETGDTNSANKFEAAEQLLIGAVAKVDSLKEFIKENVSDFSEEDAKHVRTTINEIRKEILKEVLMTIL